MDWQPIETAPFGEWVLCHSNETKVLIPAVAYKKRCDVEDGVWDGQILMVDDEGNYYPLASHWMPLPPPPTGA